MSYSSLWAINSNYIGRELKAYKNSFCFSPIVWSVLSDKTLPRDFTGNIQSIIGFDGNTVWEKINSKMNNSQNISDRICWEISNQNIFFTKDKEFIVSCIRKFLEDNNGYDKSDEDGVSILEREHIIERFNEIANDILELNENEYPYFVFKNTSVDDDVERWFYKYDEKSDEYIAISLKESEEFLAEFVIIQNGDIKDFISNLDYEYKESED